MHEASSFGHLDRSRILLTFGAGVQVQVQPTILGFVHGTREDHKNYCSSTVGADPNIHGQAPLFAVLEAGHHGIVQLPLDHGNVRWPWIQER